MITQVLSPEQIEKIHATSLAILERVGVIVPHEEILGRFADSGAEVDRKAQRVRIPPALVIQSIEQAGKQFTIYGRDLSRKAAFGTGRAQLQQHRRRGALGRHTRRISALLYDGRCRNRGSFRGRAAGHQHRRCAMADPHEVPVGYRCVEVMATLLANTSKPITFWFHDRASAKHLVDMTIAVRGNEADAARYPLCYPFLEPISPLRFPFDGIDLLFETARLNLPVPIGPMAQMGLLGAGNGRGNDGTGKRGNPRRRVHHAASARRHARMLRRHLPRVRHGYYTAHLLRTRTGDLRSRDDSGLASATDCPSTSTLA